jgi:hypothetical protein
MQRLNGAEEVIMGKQPTMWPAPSKGGVLGKLVGWLIGLALLFLLIHDPAQFAGWVKGVAQMFESLIVALAQFIQVLSK